MLVEQDTLIESGKILTYHEIKHNVDRVWPLLYDITICDDKFEDEFEKLKFIEGDTTYDLGNKFVKKWHGFNLYFECTEFLNTEYDRKINWHVYSDMQKLSFNFSYTLKENTSENSSVLIWEILYDEPEKFPMTKMIMDGSIMLRHVSLIKWDEYLHATKENLYHVESVIINSDMKSVFDLFTNWKRLSEVSPLIAEEVECRGDSTKIDSVITLFSNEKKTSTQLRVKNVDTYDPNSWYYNLECYEGQPKVNLYEIKFTIVNITENSCLLCYKHEFSKENIFQDFVNLNKDKKNILIKVKFYLENNINVV